MEGCCSDASGFSNYCDAFLKTSIKELQDIMKIGVLGLQGAFAEHMDILHRLGVESTAVKLPSELEGLDGLIIPGGESTTISRLLKTFDLMQPLKNLAQRGFPIMGTCAGMIILGTDTSDYPVETLGVMDINVKRNAFGRQVDSFETDLTIPCLGENPFHAVFIRAPMIERTGPAVETLAVLRDNTAVAARQNVLLALSFHPELTSDTRVHRLFCNMVNKHNNMSPAYA